MSDSPSKQPPPRRRGSVLLALVFQTVFGLVLPVAVIGGGGYLAWKLIKTAPEAERADRPANPRLVDFVVAEAQDRVVRVQGMGEVRAAREVMLRPEVSGRVLELGPNTDDGQLLREGDLVARLDARDYDLQLRRAQTQLAQAESQLRLEMAQQKVAREEFALLGREIPEEDAEFVLRIPQLDAARAAVDAAKVEVEAARLAQSRVELRSPFDAVVIDRVVEVGTQATTNTDLLWIAGADAFWVELLVPLDDLRWINIPQAPGEEGSRVRLLDDAWPPGISREGRVERLISQLDPASRMARVLVRVDDPLALEPANDGAPPVLLGAYLRGEVEGRVLENVVAISRAHLREGDFAWVIDEEDKLRVRRLDAAFRGAEELVLRGGIAPGERIVTSTIRTPVEGMQLRTASAPIPREGQ